MVLRNPQDPESIVPAPLSKAQPPYPTTPSDEYAPSLPLIGPAHAAHSPYPNTSLEFHVKTPGATKPPKTPDEVHSESGDDEWDQSSDEEDFDNIDPSQVPDALRPAGGKLQPVTPTIQGGLPDALKVGPRNGIPAKRSMDNISPMATGASTTSFSGMSTVSEQSPVTKPLQTNNPYLKIQTTGQQNWGSESSEAIWGNPQDHSSKCTSPVELPAYQPPVIPTQAAQDLTENSKAPPDQNFKSPDEAPLIAIDSATPQLEQPKGSFGFNPWAPDVKDSSSKFNSTDFDSLNHAPHQPDQNRWPEQQGWGKEDKEHSQSDSSSAKETSAIPQQTPHHEEQTRRLEDAELTEKVATQSTLPYAEQQTSETIPPATHSYHQEQPPALPPRRPRGESVSAVAPWPIDTGSGLSTASGPESPNTTMNKQRKENYQIKHIRWYDHNKQGMRTSPILTQNLNGPCPLLALVNALVLSTPPGVETALIETLRSRETVSLGLLLDAVFDELMSGRRGDAAQALPDVSELYKFLLALHTGLNVNPLFVPGNSAASSSVALLDRAGGFENTEDMKLYHTFDIPLLHGWLPEAGTEAYDAFNRVAKSYETSQYVQFQEEELDGKLQSGDPLSEEEQQMFTDIHAIKEFLSLWPTQLTDHGLEVIREILQRGQVAILFRNDHFSTLIKDPRTEQLVTLVTDQGYSTHDEIVWESLIDVKGQGSQLFSGDFRSVDNSEAPHGLEHQQEARNVPDPNNDQGWTTVSTRRPGHQQSNLHQSSQNIEDHASAGLSRAEQEDHDLALAIQLQEEEEDRERREAEQRQRNNQASLNAIAAQRNPQSGSSNNLQASRLEQGVVISPRRNNVTTNRPVGEVAPPPTYEEASTTPRYNPPPGHPASTQAIPQGGAYQVTSGTQPMQPHAGSQQHSGRTAHPLVSQVPHRPNRRQSAGGVINGHEERDKCVVM